jgi:hypothetical protein
VVWHWRAVSLAYPILLIAATARVRRDRDTDPFDVDDFTVEPIPQQNWSRN